MFIRENFAWVKHSKLLHCRTQAVLDVEAIEREVMEEQTRPSTEPGPRRHKFLSPIQVRYYKVLLKNIIIIYWSDIVKYC